MLQHNNSVHKTLINADIPVHPQKIPDMIRLAIIYEQQDRLSVIKLDKDFFFGITAAKRFKIVFNMVVIKQMRLFSK